MCTRYIKPIRKSSRQKAFCLVPSSERSMQMPDQTFISVQDRVGYHSKRWSSLRPVYKKKSYTHPCKKFSKVLPQHPYIQALPVHFCHQRHRVPQTKLQQAAESKHNCKQQQQQQRANFCLLFFSVSFLLKGTVADLRRKTLSHPLCKSEKASKREKERREREGGETVERKRVRETERLVQVLPWNKSI